MCMWFWRYPPVIFYQQFSTFSTEYFPGPISIRIDTLWAQILLEFSTDHFETMNTCSTWSVDVHVGLVLSSHYFYQLFIFLFFRLIFFQIRLLLEKILRDRNSSKNFPPIILKLCIHVLVFYMVCRCACGLGLSSHYFFYQFFLLYSRFDDVKCIRINTVWAQILLAFFHRSVWKYAYLFYIVWRCACGLGVILPLLFIMFFLFFELVFFQIQVVLE